MKLNGLALSALIFVSSVCPPAFAQSQTLPPTLKANDKLAVVLTSLRSKTNQEQAVVRLGACVAFNKCVGFWASHVFDVGHLDPKKLKTADGKNIPISPVFTKTELDQKFKEAAEKFKAEVRAPKPQLAAMIVTMREEGGKAVPVKKSDSAYIDLPALTLKGDHNHEIIKHVDITLDGIDCKFDLVIQRLN